MTGGVITLLPNAIFEETASGTLIGVTASAVDNDATNNTVTYRLVSDLSNNPYTAGEFSIDTNTGIISTGSTPIEYANGSQRTLYVEAMSSDGSTATSALTSAIFAGFAGGVETNTLDAHLIYDASTGDLSYSASGTDSGVLFAVIGTATHPAQLSNADFVVH